MEDKPKKGESKDIWDWKVERGDAMLSKEGISDALKRVDDMFLKYSREQVTEAVGETISKLQNQLAIVNEYIQLCEYLIEHTIDYEEALTHLVKVKSSGKIKALTGRKIALVIEGNLEIEYLQKCLKSVDNRVVLSDVFSVTDMRLERSGLLAFPDLFGDEMIFTATMRHEVVSWLQNITMQKMTAC